MTALGGQWGGSSVLRGLVAGLGASPESRDLLPMCSYELNSLLFTSSRAGGGILKHIFLVCLCVLNALYSRRRCVQRRCVQCRGNAWAAQTHFYSPGGNTSSLSSLSRPTEVHTCATTRGGRRARQDWTTCLPPTPHCSARLSPAEQ